MKCRRKNCSLKGSRPGQLCTEHYRIEPHGLIDATPAMNHVAALRAAGYSWVKLAKLTGLSGRALRNVGKWTADSSTVTLDTHQRIMAIRIPRGFAPCSGLVSAVGTRRRIQALQAAGWTQAALAEQLGINQQVVSDLMYRDRVLSKTAANVAEVFSRLQMIPGTSDVMRRRAKAWGWYPPLAWDEDTIDDPEASPNVGERDRRAEILEDVAEKRERVAQLTRMGLTAGEIAERIGVTKRHVVRYRASLQEAS